MHTQFSTYNIAAINAVLLSFLADDYANIFLGEKIPLDILLHEEHGAMTVIVPAGRKINLTLIRKMAEAGDNIEIDPSPIRNMLRRKLTEWNASKYDRLIDYCTITKFQEETGRPAIAQQ